MEEIVRYSELDPYPPDEGQALVEYTMIIACIIIAILGTLSVFQDAVIDGLLDLAVSITDSL